MERILSILITMIMLLFISCNYTPDTQAILNRAVETHGLSQLEKCTLSFNYEGRHFQMYHSGGQQRWESSYVDTLKGIVSERMDADSFYREINGVPQNLNSTEYRTFSQSFQETINMIIFSGIINNPDHRQKYLGSVRLDGIPYYKIGVDSIAADARLNREYIVFVHQNDFTMDYWAYHTADGDSVVLKQAINGRKVRQIRFYDFNSYVAPLPEKGLIAVDDIFKDEIMKKLKSKEIRRINVSCGSVEQRQQGL